MKRSKLVLAAASIVLAGASIAATKPMRNLQAAFNQQRNGVGVPTACVQVTSPCNNASAVPCTTAGTISDPTFGQSIYLLQSQDNPSQCEDRLTKDNS